MLGWLSFAISLVASFHLSNTQSNFDLCENCTLVNGAGYTSHPYECDKFIQCHSDDLGNLVGNIHQCAFPLYWDMSLLTCVPVERAACTYDKCLNKPNGYIYGATNNCRGYWRCYSGVSDPRCCSNGQRFNRQINRCVDIMAAYECADKCFDPLKIDAICPNKRDSTLGLPGTYEENVAGWGWMTRACAPGTSFVKQSCRCIGFGPLKTTTPQCRAEIHLPFSKDHKDKSGNGYYVGQENVFIRNGAAIFNGKDSRLIIPRFTNFDHSSTIVIKAKYRSYQSTYPRQQAIVSNNDCNNMPSILVYEDATDITFGVGTSKKFFTSTSVHRTGFADENIVYKFENGVLNGSNGVRTTSTLAPGYLRNVHCALHIGHAQNMTEHQRFWGEIDDIKVYLCNPDG